MYEPLLARLSAHYHLVAPDYPGFGHSDAPSAKVFSYTFDHIAEIMQHFTEALHLDRYALNMQDYGGPVGFRLAIAHPERVQAFIIQNAVAHEDGLGPLWQKRREFWADRAANEAGLGSIDARSDPHRLLLVDGYPYHPRSERTRRITVELEDFRWTTVASHHRSLRQAAETLNVRQSTLKQPGGRHISRALEGRPDARPDTLKPH